MKKSRSWLGVVFVGLLLLLILSGCFGEYGIYRLGPARDIVAQSIESMGGLHAWKKIDCIRATVVVTTYDVGDRPYVNRQQQVIDLKNRTITATARTSQGTWKAVIRKDKLVRLNTSGFSASDEMRNRIESSLAVILHRVGGPMNLLRGVERPVGARRVRLGEKDLIRVPVSGDSRFAVAYYFDPVSGMLQFVSSGADRPGCSGTVTGYTYAMQSNGLMFPQNIRVTRIGQNDLVGRELVMEAEFSDVRFE